MAIRQQIMISEKEWANNLFELHKNLLESHGFRKEDLITDRFKEARKSEVDTAKDELPKIEALLKAYYKAMMEADESGLRKVIASALPDAPRRLKEEAMLNRSEMKATAVEFDDKTKMTLGLDSSGNLLVYVKGVKLTVLKKDGSEFIHRRGDTFKLTKEKGEWRLWCD